MPLSNQRLVSKAPIHAAVISSLLLAPAAYAQVIPFVDNYKTNVTTNTSVETNAADALLSGFSTLWTTGTTWDTGAPTAIGAYVMEASQHFVVRATEHLTPAQAESVYFTDRRNQSYSATIGLGALADAYRTAAGATTTITTVASNADVAIYNDEGTGAGATSSPTVGQIVALVGTLRGSFSSTTPAKNFFNEPRPWRLNDAVQVMDLGTETTGYTTQDLADGTPNLGTPLTYFPLYQTHVVIPATLKAVRSTTPATDGSFVSGHTNAGYLASFAMAYAMPQYFQGLLLNASQIGQNRIEAGMHSPLDVMGGRMLSTALAAAILYDPANAALESGALAQGQAFVTASNAVPADAVDPKSLAAHEQDKRLYTFRMTYGLPTADSEDIPATVPQGAEVLLATRQPYLDTDQRREVLRTTAISSGDPLLDDTEGWGRLNLYAAADGYGRFDADVTVNMDASRGGFAARDLWRNAIAGVGKLTKQGTGELDLTGENTYSGGTEIDNGVLLAASATALGSGGVVLNGGSLVDFAPVALRVGGNYTQSNASTLEVTVGCGTDGINRGALLVRGSAHLGGHLHITSAGPVPRNPIPLIVSGGPRSGTFDDVTVTGVGRARTSLTYGPNFVLLNILH